MRSILRYATGRVLLTTTVVLFQVVAAVALYMGLWECSVYVRVASRVVGVAFALWVSSGDADPAYRALWTLVLLALPMGWLVYLTFHGTRTTERRVLPYGDLPDLTEPYATGSPSTLEALSEESAQYSRAFRYVREVCGTDAYRDTDTKYYPCGEYFFLDYLESLRSAKRYIFLEYFIVSEGTLWDSVLGILREKAAQGVEVRLVYDGLGTVGLLPPHYDAYLASLGVQTLVFNPVRLYPDSAVGFRDHRKLTVVDGTVAYTGGLNLSDEYVNRVERFGYWKDSAIRLRGSAVRSVVVSYLRLWNACTYGDADRPLHRYFDGVAPVPAQGYVLPYSDNPFDRCAPSKHAYLSTVRCAKRYVYVCTPYLVLDSETLSALRCASLSGVDVRVVTPHVPDKRYVYEVTRSYYLPLLRAGVRVFEFRDGFIHSKAIVADDEYALVGTANLDYRSLYLHFEDGVLMYRTRAVLQVRDDCLGVFESQSVEVLESDCTELPLHTKLLRLLLRPFSPLM